MSLYPFRSRDIGMNTGNIQIKYARKKHLFSLEKEVLKLLTFFEKKSGNPMKYYRLKNLFLPVRK